MFKSHRKGFTLIEIIVVIVILAVLMAFAVPSVMSYMKKGNEAKYLAVSRSAYQDVTVELSKFEGGMSNYKNPQAACNAAVEKINKSAPDDLKIIRGKITYDNDTTIAFTVGSSLPGPGSLKSQQTADHIQYVYFYFKKNSPEYSKYTTVYPNKKVEYHTLSF